MNFGAYEIERRYSDLAIPADSRDKASHFQDTAFLKLLCKYGDCIGGAPVQMGVRPDKRFRAKRLLVYSPRQREGASLASISTLEWSKGGAWCTIHHPLAPIR